MTTRLDLRNALRQVLADPAAWPDAALNAWIDAAIQDYSLHFPAAGAGGVATQAGVRRYELSGLPDRLLAVTSLEYPASETPPRYLYRMSEKSSGFWEQPCYDFYFEGVGATPYLVIGENPPEGAGIRFTYTTYHSLPASDDAVLSVPDHHLEALKLFCYWQALRLLELDEAATPSTTLEFTLSNLSAALLRAERAYRTKIEEYKSGSGIGSYSGPWVMDQKDRIY